MTRTAKTTATKPANTKGKVKVEVQVEDTPRLNRYERSAAIIVGNLTISVDALSAQAEMSTSTARHCLDAFRSVVGVLLQHGAISQAWQARLKPKAPEKAPEVVTAK